MRQAAWILAYHGCDAKTGESILAGKGEIHCSSNPYDWLGGGAYFWENSQARALHWAEYLKENPAASTSKINTPFAIGAIIDPGYCLNLSTEESLATLKSAFTDFSDLMEMVSLPLPKNEPSHGSDEDLVKRKLDCAVINYLHDIRKGRRETPFDTVCCPFAEGKPLFPGSKIPEKNHIQWCVREPAKSVLGYFRPRHPGTE